MGGGGGAWRDIDTCQCHAMHLHLHLHLPPPTSHMLCNMARVNITPCTSTSTSTSHLEWSGVEWSEGLLQPRCRLHPNALHEDQLVHRLGVIQHFQGPFSELVSQVFRHDGPDALQCALQ